MTYDQPSGGQPWPSRISNTVRTRRSRSIRRPDTKVQFTLDSGMGPQTGRGTYAAEGSTAPDAGWYVRAGCQRPSQGRSSGRVT